MPTELGAILEGGVDVKGWVIAETSMPSVGRTPR